MTPELMESLLWRFALDAVLFVALMIAACRWWSLKHQWRRHEKFAQQGENLVRRLEELLQRVDEDISTREAKMREMVRTLQALLEKLDEKRACLLALLEGAGRVSGRGPSASSPAQTSPEGEGGAMDDPRYGQVTQLAEEGLSVEEISRRLDLPRGEVDLILGLGKKAGES